MASHTNSILKGFRSFFGGASASTPPQPQQSLQPLWNRAAQPPSDSPQSSQWSLLPDEENIPDRIQRILPEGWNSGNGPRWSLLPDEETSPELDSGEVVLPDSWENPFSDAVVDVSQVQTNFLKAFKRALEFKKDVEAHPSDFNWNNCSKIGNGLSEALKRLRENDPQGYQALFNRVGDRAMSFRQEDSFLWSIDYFQAFLGTGDTKALLEEIEGIIGFESKERRCFRQALRGFECTKEKAKKEEYRTKANGILIEMKKNDPLGYLAYLRVWQRCRTSVKVDAWLNELKQPDLETLQNHFKGNPEGLKQEIIRLEASLISKMILSRSNSFYIPLIQ